MVLPVGRNSAMGAIIQRITTGGNVADDLRQVLNYIVSRYVVADDLRAIDRDTPVTSNATNDGEKLDAARREEEQADRLADAFGQGLVRAWQRFSMGGDEIPLDDRKPDENRIADALIRFLVSFNLARSRTEATSARTYTYYLSVDWPRLRDVALAAGVDLDKALTRQAERLER